MSEASALIAIMRPDGSATGPFVQRLPEDCNAICDLVEALLSLLRDIDEKLIHHIAGSGVVEDEEVLVAGALHDRIVAALAEG